MGFGVITSGGAGVGGTVDATARADANRDLANAGDSVPAGEQRFITQIGVFMENPTGAAIPIAVGDDLAALEAKGLVKVGTGSGPAGTTTPGYRAAAVAGNDRLTQPLPADVGETEWAVGAIIYRDTATGIRQRWITDTTTTASATPDQEIMPDEESPLTTQPATPVAVGSDGWQIGDSIVVRDDSGPTPTFEKQVWVDAGSGMMVLEAAEYESSVADIEETFDTQDLGSLGGAQTVSPTKRHVDVVLTADTQFTFTALGANVARTHEFWILRDDPNNNWVPTFTQLVTGQSQPVMPLGLTDKWLVTVHLNNDKVYIQ